MQDSFAAGLQPDRRSSLSQSQSISANIDLIAKLRRQLEERDVEIASLRVCALHHCHALAMQQYE